MPSISDESLDRVLPVNAEITDEGLLVGGRRVTDIAARYGTPALVVDRVTIEERAKAYAAALGAENVYFGSKAFPNIAICQIVAAAGLGIDVCTGGELEVALRAGVAPERILFHGNNKSEAELKAAGEAGVGRIVLDSFDEIERAARLRLSNRLLVRVTPAIVPDTHAHIQTGGEGSKFGFSITGGAALAALRKVSETPGLNLVGLHCHVGSQMHDLTASKHAAERLAELAAQARSELGIELAEMDLGGGLGIAYTATDPLVDVGSAAAELRAWTEGRFAACGLPKPRIMVEPGRSITGPAAFTVYTVGTVKSAGDKIIAAVDGGMSDNIRPALYGAEYTAALAGPGKGREPAVPTTIVGKHCESGDVLVDGAPLPADLAAGDLVAVFATGAYTYALASNYNRVGRPPVLLAQGSGELIEIARRETVDDMLRLERPL